MTQRRGPVTDMDYTLETAAEVDYCNRRWFQGSHSSRVLGNTSRGHVSFTRDSLAEFNRAMGYIRPVNEFYIVEPLPLPC